MEFEVDPKPFEQWEHSFEELDILYLCQSVQIDFKYLLLVLRQIFPSSHHYDSTHWFLPFLHSYICAGWVFWLLSEEIWSSWVLNRWKSVLRVWDRREVLVKTRLPTFPCRWLPRRTKRSNWTWAMCSICWIEYFFSFAGNHWSRIAGEWSISRHEGSWNSRRWSNCHWRWKVSVSEWGLTIIWVWLCLLAP